MNSESIQLATPADDEQQLAEAIYLRISRLFDEEARRLAQLMAAKKPHEILGKTEYEVRDHVHALGAQVLAATVESQSKKGVRGC